MAATAGTLLMQGKSGRTYSVDVYIPDATGTLLTFNPAGLATTTSQNTFRVPEDVVIYDVSIGTAPTAVGVALNINGAVKNGAALRWANQLQTLANRAKISIPVQAGDFLGGVQF